MHLKGLHVLVALLVGGVQSSFLPWHQFRRGLETRAPTFDYGNVKVRGVNLGGWFVLEREFPQSNPPSAPFLRVKFFSSEFQHF